MSHSYETNQKKFSRRENDSKSIWKHIHDLAKELEIDSADGLEGNEMEIIALIRNCPLLYDKSLVDYNDAKKKDQAWKAIAELFSVSSRDEDNFSLFHLVIILSFSGKDLQRFWESLKQSFVKFGGGSVANGSDYPSYFYEMQFLNTFNTNNRKPSVSLNPTVYRKEDSNSSDSSEQDVSNTYNEMNELNVDALIEKIRTNPILYDRKHKDAKNHDLKLKTWKKLAKEIGIPVSECVNRWKILREEYGKERKYRKLNPGGQRWYLFEKLSFLEGHVFKKKYSHTQMSSRLSKGVFNNDISSLLRNDVFSSEKSLMEEYNFQGIDSIRGRTTNNENNDINFDKFSTRQFFGDQYGLRNDNFISNVIDDSLLDDDEVFAVKIVTELKKITNCRKKTKLKADIFRLLQECSKN